MIICDLDDFAEDARSAADLGRLMDIRTAISTFKATLFTIPGRCSAAFVAGIRRDFPWLDLVPHGWLHATNRECEKWTKAECKAALAAARDIGITTKGFKAPGWQISEGCYEALAEEGYWVADQEYNEERRPIRVSAYEICAEDRGPEPIIWHQGKEYGWMRASAIHGHIGHLNGRNENALELMLSQILQAGKADSDFRFISEVMAC